MTKISKAGENVEGINTAQCDGAEVAVVEFGREVRLRYNGTCASMLPIHRVVVGDWMDVAGGMLPWVNVQGIFGWGRSGTEKVLRRDEANS